MIQGDEKKNIFKSDKNKKIMIYLLKHNAFRNEIVKQYSFLKENCKITDEEIAKLLKMSRSTMNLKLKNQELNENRTRKVVPFWQKCLFIINGEYLDFLKIFKNI